MKGVFLLIGAVSLVLAVSAWADDAVPENPDGENTASTFWRNSAVFYWQPIEQSRAQLVVVAYCGDGGKGQIIASLFDSAAGFPRKPVRRLYVPVAQDGTARIEFPDLKPGDYAVTAVHDEDMNGRLNRNLLGVPTEQYGISNDIRPSLRSPKWEEAKFIVTPPRTEISIRMAPYKLVSARY